MCIIICCVMCFCIYTSFNVFYLSQHAKSTRYEKIYKSSFVNLPCFFQVSFCYYFHENLYNPPCNCWVFFQLNLKYSVFLFIPIQIWVPNGIPAVRSPYICSSHLFRNSRIMVHGSGWVWELKSKICLFMHSPEIMRKL